MHDRPAAFLKTNCVQTTSRTLVGTFWNMHTWIRGRRSHAICLARRCRWWSCAPATLYWKVDQIETSYYLLHSTYASGRHHFIHIDRFPSDDGLQWVCVRAGEWVPDARCSFVCFPLSCQFETFMRSALVSWLPVVCASIFCNKCPIFSRSCHTHCSFVSIFVA